MELLLALRRVERLRAQVLSLSNSLSIALHADHLAAGIGDILARVALGIDVAAVAAVGLDLALAILVGRGRGSIGLAVVFRHGHVLLALRLVA